MKISLNWLNEYVDVLEFAKKPEELAQHLTGAGLEVEGFENLAKALQNVVVGQIIELGRHPNADKLTLCQVNTGEGKPRQIVCGAKNHKQGDLVVVALPGAVLPGDFAIKLSKIRDVESQGMLCSETELGFKTESEGIIILPKEAKVGTPYAEYAGLNDVVFEINVTPNRADCLSHVGLAREVSCLLDRDLKYPKSQLKATVHKTKDLIDVKLNDEALCPRYCGRSIVKVEVKESPAWLIQRLKSVGMNSINNVVDITNFVMMEYGQPLHAFDAKELNGKKIIVEKSKVAEKFKSFDGTEFSLTGEELTIRDGEKAVALAGVVGGVNSGVTNKTTEIFLEAAYFSPKGVRSTSRRLGIDTDSSYRYSRGTDPDNVVEAMNRACQLMQDLAGGEVAKDFIDIYPHPASRMGIKVRKETLETRLGYAVELNDFAKWMKRLSCKTKVSGDTINVETPSFRFDLEIEMDLVEEYARLNGYDKIPETFPVLAQRPGVNASGFQNENRVAEMIKDEGYLEARNYNFVSAKWQSELVNEKLLQTLGLNVGGMPVAIKNPLSEETGVMRQSLLPGLLTNLKTNYHYGSHVGRLFEVGCVFGKSEAEYVESSRVAMVAWGQKTGLWTKTERPVVYDVKAAVEGMFKRLKGQVQWKKTDGIQLPSFAHPGQASLLFYEGKVIGFLAALHPAFREEHKIRHEGAVCEIDLAALMRGQPKLAKLTKIAKFPVVERDLALVMPITLAAGDVLKEIEKAGAPLVQSVEIFDVYKGQGVPDGQQSVAFRLLLQDFAATLSEAQITDITQKILASLEKKFSIKTR